ncbi:response regulator [Paraglaciecola aquimarina]|uniref:histidine kinase n=1 Tax=Paraglaciecola algarum TaxID=3050085 RepID=A0ABS9D2R8_9ALTE|nr:response regulator [Paraglaciecola sp. G1-23]MCF2947221.1 response regulator [Paraglaciecola sp. G1-23]
MIRTKKPKLLELKLLFFGFFFFLFNSQLLANSVKTEIQPQLNFETFIYQEKDISFSVPNFRSFIQSNLQQLTPVKSIKLTGGSYWYHLIIPAQSVNKDWVLDVKNSVVEDINIYWFQETLITQQVSGFYQAQEFPFHYGRKFSLEAGKPYEVLVKINSRYFASQPVVQIVDSQQYQDDTLLNTVLILCSLGALLALGLYNLFVYAGSKDKSHLYYSLYLISYFLGWSLVFQIPNNLFGFHYIELIYIPFFLLPLVGGYFCISFLQLDIYLPRLAKILKVNGFVSFALLPSSIFLVGYAHSIATVTIGVWIFSAVVAGFKRLRMGFRPARYFILGFLSLLIPACFILPANIGLIPDLLDNAELFTLIGGTVDAIFLAFALANRLALVTHENSNLTTNLEKTVQQRTQELSQTNHQLELTNSELIEANYIKGRFLATMSHEIRTPLTSIIGYADGILLGDIDKSEQDRVIKIIYQNGSHLLNVLNDIIDLNKIEANKLDFENVPTQLFSVLAQIESIVGKRARDKGLAFHLDYQYPLPTTIYTDPTRLKQILFNLTNNAIKFTEQGYIGLSVTIKDNSLQIQVKDTGEGISAKQQKVLFEPFNQANISINQYQGGTGLGLSISQRLANGLNGKIMVESTPRKGSTFTLAIKLNPVENCQWLNNVSEIWQLTPTKSVTPDILPNFSGHKVLLADDHPANRELIAILLKRMNLAVVEVEDGKQALDTLYYQKFDLILLDIHMPKMDGTQALKKIRLSGNNTPVIALTANNMKHEVEHYLRLGFSDHLAKPISRRHFIETLSKYLTKHGDVENPINQSDMLKLIADYQQDLANQIENAEKALEQRDMSLISEIAHRIKGSAAAFGFDLIGNKYADIEHSALQDDEIAVSYELPKILSLSKLFIDLPGVNIPIGITNHHNSAEQFIKNVYKLTANFEAIINDLDNTLKNKELNSTLIYLYKLMPMVNDCALTETSKLLNTLEKLIKTGQWGARETSDLLEQIKQNIQLLSSKLPVDLLNQI